MADLRLKAAGLKSTKGRELILAELDRAPLALTAEELHALVSRRHRVDLSTVYRVLQTLEQHAIVQRSVNMEGVSGYQLNRREHCHRLVCSSCRRTVVIDQCPLEELCRRLSKQTGYTITGHSLELSGLCPDCAEKKQG